jgi:hypothetical protein
MSKPLSILHPKDNTFEGNSEGNLLFMQLSMLCLLRSFTLEVVMKQELWQEGMLALNQHSFPQPDEMVRGLRARNKIFYPK